MKDWIICSSCGEEFKVITDSLETPAFCPLCGEELEDETEDDEFWDDE
jgi:predicted amidophosphoribosyltransferase